MLRDILKRQGRGRNPIGNFPKGAGMPDNAARQEGTMGRRFVFAAVSLFFITGIFLAIDTDSSAASCRDECYTSCCGDEGICNAEDEEACVSDCLKDCDDDIPVITAPADDGSSDDEGGGAADDGNADGN